MTAPVLIAVLAVAFPFAAMAHALSVFASTDCEYLIVEAKFSNGKTAKSGELRILDGNNLLLLSQQISPDSEGLNKIALNQLEVSTGIVVEVDTGTHDNYWILTPQDIANGCRN